MTGSTSEHAQPGWELVTVEAQSRVRLSAATLDRLPWIRQGTITCEATLGRLGGLVVVAESFLETATESDFQTEDSNGFPNFLTEEERSSVNNFVRWSVSLLWEEARNRHSLTLPVGARQLKIVPKAGELAAIVVAQKTLQIWPPVMLRALARMTQADVEKLRWRMLLDELKESGQLS